VQEVRYEQLVTDPGSAAAGLAAAIDAPLEPLLRALSEARHESIGRYRRDLTAEQLAEVETEGGRLLAALGYLQ
jgi:hypothetical protein